MITPYVFMIYIALVICIAWLGRDRKFGYWGYLFASLLLTPVIGLLLYLATDGPFRRSEPSKGDDR